jgi:hypothetical protein
VTWLTGLLTPIAILGIAQMDEIWSTMFWEIHFTLQLPSLRFFPWTRPLEHFTRVPRSISSIIHAAVTRWASAARFYAEKVVKRRALSALREYLLTRFEIFAQYEILERRLEPTKLVQTPHVTIRRQLALTNLVTKVGGHGHSTFAEQLHMNRIAENVRISHALSFDRRPNNTI